MKNNLPNQTPLLAKTLEVLLHLLFWASGILLMYWFFGVRTEMMCIIDGQEQMTVYREKESLYFLLVGAFIKASFFYWNALWVFSSFLEKRKYQQYIGWATLLVLTGIFIELAITRFFIYPDASLRMLVRNPLIGFNVLSWLFYWGVSVSYGMVRQWRQNEQLRQALMEEKLKTELDFLKFQINPHFLFNTLNNLFSIAQKYKVRELEDGLSSLAGLMRYMVYESNVEKVALEKEVKYLQDFIEMQQLQYDENDNIIINFKIKGDLTGKYIAPMLLVPFVENAFKHGVDISMDSIIQIGLEIEQDKLRFQVGNTCHYVSPELEHQTKGIGLANVKRRLELLYPKNYQLSIEQHNRFFKCLLTLPLISSVSEPDYSTKATTTL